jgi:hypothetical protein
VSRGRSSRTRSRGSVGLGVVAFRFDPEDLIAGYVDVAAPPMAAIHRELALQIEADWRRNGRIVRRLREALQVGHDRAGRRDVTR